MVVSKGGCVVDGVFAKCPAFALLDSTSVFFILAVLFVPVAGSGSDDD
jgi:dolichyl-phosphate-mannose--protein O-mannosyl transferase